MRPVTLLAAFIPALLAGQNLLPPPGPAWRTWAPREAIATRQEIVTVEGGQALRQSARRYGCYGKWMARAANLQPGRYYRFKSLYRTEGVVSDAASVAFLVSWLTADNRTLQRDYVDGLSSVGAWKRLSRTLRAPERTASADVELMLRWTEKGSVVWRGPSLTEAEAPAPRKARIVTTRIQPGPSPTVEKNIQLMADTFDRAAAHKPDLVLFTENLVDRWVRAPLTETSQTIPGPATRMLSEKARQYHTWVATSLHERDGELLYNTAVLIDREGRIAGKYRKSHLTLMEGDNGLTVGRDYPVFQTDFGRVGLLVCWDIWFPEPARLMRLNGAEVVLLPIAGDGVPGHWDVISRARAMENGVFLVAASTGTVSPSRIVDPDGRVLAETADGIAFAEIDLNNETRLPWLSVGAGEGEGKSLDIKERRPDTYDGMVAR